MDSLRIPIALVVATLLLALVFGRGRAQIGTIIPTPAPTASLMPTPRPATISRSFHCNCTFAGHPVIWAGNVEASSYFQARQIASVQCSAYLGSKPFSPLIPTPAVGVGAAPTFAPLVLSTCGQCACN
jgi:hypothetical protein